MIKKFVFRDFKSFQEAELYTESFTTLIGTNASGKSNAIEGIRILSDIANGIDFSVILDGNKRETAPGIRGGSSGCCRFEATSFLLGCSVTLDGEFDLDYEIRIEVEPRIYVVEESLYKISKSGKVKEPELIFKSKPAINGSGDIKVEYANRKRGTNPDVSCNRNAAALTQMKAKFPAEKTYKDHINCIETVISNLKNILFLDPVPSQMRDYVRATDVEMKPTGSNISAVLKQMCSDSEKKAQFLEIIKSLPENEILDVSFVDTSLGDVIFTLNERYADTSKQIDAKRLSDGTLRCVAIITAMLTEQENSMVIVEEIDNGIHPGRANGLVEKISMIGSDRKIDVILTTHNATLLNNLSRNNLAGVTVAYRDQQDGASKFQALLDMVDYPRLLVNGLGDSVIDNTLIQAIKKSKCEVQKVDLSWLEGI